MARLIIRLCGAVPVGLIRAPLFSTRNLPAGLSNAVPACLLPESVCHVSSQALAASIHRSLDRGIVLHCCNAVAADWSGPAQQLARKIAALTGPGTVAFTVQNRSSLSTKDVERIKADLRSGCNCWACIRRNRSAPPAACRCSDPQGYVWVAEMQVGSQSGVVLVPLARPEGGALAHDESGLTIHKIPLWEQEDRILDVVVLEQDSAPKHIAVLDGEKVALYGRRIPTWQQEKALAIAHAKPWPRSARAADRGQRPFAGRLSPRRFLPQHDGNSPEPELPRK